MRELVIKDNLPNSKRLQRCHDAAMVCGAQHSGSSMLISSWDLQVGAGVAYAARRLALIVLAFVMSGCAALTNPVAEGIPVSLLPPELLGKSKNAMLQTPLSCLSQPSPKTHLLGPGDVLSIWIEGVLGESSNQQQLPASGQLVNPSLIVNSGLVEKDKLSSGVGYPVTVNSSGAVTLPYVGSIRVEGQSVDEAREAIRAVYAAKKILKPGQERILVTLVRPRSYRVIVFRQEFTSFSSFSDQAAITGFIGTNKRGTGNIVDLPAYENDVAHALAATGGLPGLDVSDQIIVERGPQPAGAGVDPAERLVRIPLRYYPSQEPRFRPEDVILQEGDFIILPPRDREIFFAQGLLPAGYYFLPQNRDLDVIEAITQIRGSVVSGALSTNGLSGAMVFPGIGNPSPSLLTIVRKTPGQSQVAIRVDLNRALRDARERIPIQPGDVLILQETPTEALARYFSEVFRLNFVGRFINRQDAQGTTGFTVPP